MLSGVVVLLICLYLSQYYLLNKKNYANVSYSGAPVHYYHNTIVMSHARNKKMKHVNQVNQVNQQMQVQVQGQVYNIITFENYLRSGGLGSMSDPRENSEKFNKKITQP
jgi:hypothetical protein